MNIHKNARLTPSRREEMARAVIEGRLSKAAAARTYGVTAKIVVRWVGRFLSEGPTGMADRSSRPKRSPAQTPATVADEIAALRRRRLTGQHIARQAGVIHIDIKKLGRFERVGHRITGDRAGQSNSRGVGWEFVHVCIDDASRIAFSQILPDEKKESAIAFLAAAVAYYASLGIVVERVMTDNGSCYRSKAFARACRKLGLKHIRTRPYTPKDQRQGRALHPDRAQGMGLCRRIPDFRPSRRRAARLASSL
jgi:transposase InsO family protein